MSDHRERALRLIQGALDAMATAAPDKLGIWPYLLIGAQEGVALRQFLEEAADDATFRAVVLAYHLGLVIGIVRNKEVWGIVNAGQEKIKWPDPRLVYKVAGDLGYTLPVDLAKKAHLRREWRKRTGLTERTFRNHYREAVAFAEELRLHELMRSLAREAIHSSANGKGLVPTKRSPNLLETYRRFLEEPWPLTDGNPDMSLIHWHLRNALVNLDQLGKAETGNP